MKVMRDKFGLEYEVAEFSRDHNSFKISLKHNHQEIAYLNFLSFPGQALVIHDLRINSAVQPIREPCFKRFLRWCMRNPPLTNFQRRGLGPQLLALVEERARRDGVQEITGGIVDRDLAQFPNLPDWYRSHGYTVTIASAESKTLGRLTIRKLLQPNSTSQTQQAQKIPPSKEQ